MSILPSVLPVSLLWFHASASDEGFFAWNTIADMVAGASIGDVLIEREADTPRETQGMHACACICAHACAQVRTRTRLCARTHTHADAHPHRTYLMLMHIHA